MLTKWFMRFHIIEENRRYNEQECSPFQSVEKIKFPLKIIFLAVKNRFLDFPLFFITFIDLSGILYTNLFKFRVEYPPTRILSFF